MRVPEGGNQTKNIIIKPETKNQPRLPQSQDTLWYRLERGRKANCGGQAKTRNPIYFSPAKPYTPSQTKATENLHQHLLVLASKRTRFLSSLYLRFFQEKTASKKYFS